MSFEKILDKYRKAAFSERDKGTRFEQIIQMYLQTDPQYANLFKNVWMWNDFHGKRDLGGKDTGIDLVALTHTGDYWAIQCKCVQETKYTDKPAVDSFLATSSREFQNEQLQTTRFANRLWVSTTNKWSSNAEEAIVNQNPPVTRINLSDLKQAPVDWDKLEEGTHGEAARTAKKTLRPHQKEAMDKTHEYFKTADRGKLIMACGTGKTFNSLRIAENETDGKGLILFLVPSIALLGQTLREWSADADEPINAICICSDPEISKTRTKGTNPDKDGFKTVDLAAPASTNTEYIIKQFEQIKAKKLPGMTVVFSTYQSIEVLARAQKAWMEKGFPEFDLIICDEAHRTTGVSLVGEDESAFTKVHDKDFIQAKKRIYMTATPRLYSADIKDKAKQAEATLCSMDEKEQYGEEIYRIGFGEAVEKGLLTDYKVLILTINDQDVPPGIKEMLIKGEMEIDANDTAKLIGTITALSKQFLGDQGITKAEDPDPMRRAVVFCSSIKDSNIIKDTYNSIGDVYVDSLPDDDKNQMVRVSAQHMDGTMAAPQRGEMLSWLKEDTQDNECRMITNVRVLSEGVDVPSLDAVLFLSARNSQVDVVQSVGRVMRKSPGKKYGYIIIPVVVPSNIEAEEAMEKNDYFKVVWTVLNALRAHDDRFNATVNKIELNKSKPKNIVTGRAKNTFDSGGNVHDYIEDAEAKKKAQEINEQLAIQFEQLQSVIFARMVKKVGERRYWEQWAKDVAFIADKQIERITDIVENQKEQKQAFENFLAGLQKNINPSISESQAIEMLAQHIITKPVFEALFEGYSFVKNNAVSTAMQSMLDILEDKLAPEESETLQKFYASVRMRAEDIDNAEAKQTVIIELYDKFFKTAFPKMVEQLGIVYTPVEVVDFIIHSVNDVLKKEFDRNISDENIHILDPFTGTGTFITRLLQSGLIDKKDLERKYKYELHANEIVLLAYYIAAVNIENAFHDVHTPDSAESPQGNEYIPFDGICLTDTFQLGETDASEKLFSEMFPQNSERVVAQKKAPLRIIMGNPPYSKGQKSANDDAQNQEYQKLDSRIAKTYVKEAKTGEKMMALYDSYIKAFRWSTDRLDPEHGGIIAFVSNGAWLDSNSTNGFRKTLEKEFTSIYVFNLRGNARTSGELRRKEAGNAFGSGSRTPISITLLVKNPNVKAEKAIIHYYDIGDYLNREDKLEIISKFKTVLNSEMDWKTLQPNVHGDWINMRNEVYNNFIPLDAEKKYDTKSQSFFICVSGAIVSSRDAWVFNFSKKELQKNIRLTIEHYNEQRELVTNGLQKTPVLDSKKGNWSAVLLSKLKSNIKIVEEDEYRIAQYRPFVKSNTYFSSFLNHSRYQLPRIFPKNCDNLVICSTGKSLFSFSVLISDKVTEFGFLNGRNGTTQCFPLYYYEEREKQNPGLFDAGGEDEYVRRDGVSDFILERAQKQYGISTGSTTAIDKEDIFYYVYGILHSPDYREAFSNDLKKMLPRLPLVEDVRDFWKFSKAGRALAALHINYEVVPALPEVRILIDKIPQSAIESGIAGDELATVDYKVQKMRFPKKGQKETIIYNNQLTLDNIPAKAYEYVVNGKSAIEWIMERYQVKIDKNSGIKNDPNDWSFETNNPKYIFNLLQSIINVSVQTVDIVNELPKLSF